MWFIAVLLLAVFVAGCGGSSGSNGGYWYGGDGGGSTPAPTVTFTDPADGATGVPINKIINATFSVAMDPTTITNTTFTLTGPGAAPVSGAVTYAGLGATFTPAANLAFNTTFTATITTGARDLAGNALAANYTWSFTTGATADTTAPTVTFTDPDNGDTGVPTNKKIAATFSKGMDDSVYFRQVKFFLPESMNRHP